MSKKGGSSQTQNKSALKILKTKGVPVVPFRDTVNHNKPTRVLCDKTGEFTTNRRASTDGPRPPGSVSATGKGSFPKYHQSPHVWNTEFAGKALAEQLDLYAKSPLTLEQLRPASTTFSSNRWIATPLDRPKTSMGLSTLPSIGMEDNPAPPPSRGTVASLLESRRRRLATPSDDKKSLSYLSKELRRNKASPVIQVEAVAVEPTSRLDLGPRPPTIVKRENERAKSPEMLSSPQARRTPNLPSRGQLLNSAASGLFDTTFDPADAGEQFEINTEPWLEAGGGEVVHPTSWSMPVADQFMHLPGRPQPTTPEVISKFEMRSSTPVIHKNRLVSDALNFVYIKPLQPPPPPPPLPPPDWKWWKKGRSKQQSLGGSLAFEDRSVEDLHESVASTLAEGLMDRYGSKSDASDCSKSEDVSRASSARSTVLTFLTEPPEKFKPTPIPVSSRVSNTPLSTARATQFQQQVAEELGETNFDSDEDEPHSVLPKPPKTEQHSLLSSTLYFFEVFASRLAFNGEDYEPPPLTSRTQFLRKSDSYGLPPMACVIPKSKDSKTLDLSYYSVGDRLAQCIAEGLKYDPTIQTVSLAHNRMAPESCIALAAVLNVRKFKNVDVSNNVIGIAGCEALVQAVVGNRFLTQLRLSKCGLNDYCCKILCQAVVDSISLSLLDLSHNNITYRTGSAWQELFLCNNSLTNLDLGWNTMKGKGFADFCDGLTVNRALTTLNLCWNGLENDELGCLQSALATNEGLLELNISYNRVTEPGCFMLAESIKANRTLLRLVLDGNPIGGGGGRVLTRCIAEDPTREPLYVSMKHCNFEEVPSEITYDPLDPSGHYRFNLEDPYHRSVCTRLLSQAVESLPPRTTTAEDKENRGTKLTLVFNELFNGRPYRITDKFARNIPTSGVLEFDFGFVGGVSGILLSAENFTSLCAEITDIAESGGRASEFIHMKTREFLLTAEQACGMIRALHDTDERIAAAVSLYLRVVDSQNMFEFLDLLTPPERARVQRKLGRLADFDPRFPTGHWQLNLSNRYDRDVVKQLRYISSKQRQWCKDNNIPELGQHKGSECWRNCFYNGSAFAYSSKWLTPASGLLEFDFVACERPASDSYVIPDGEFQLLVQFWELMDEEEHLELVKTQIRAFTMTCEQAVRILDIFKKEEDKIEVMIYLFPQVNDLRDFHRCYSVLSDANQRLLFRRLGYLNIWNVMAAERYFELDLSLQDERRVCEILVLLAIKEPGENWCDETFNGRGFELPVSWVTEVPRRGVTTLTYVTKPHEVIKSLRTRCAARTLVGYDYARAESNSLPKQKKEADEEAETHPGQRGEESEEGPKVHEDEGSRSQPGSGRSKP